MSAVISPCGKYRYLLRRGNEGVPHRTLGFIMLNPSTADANVDDPTIRKCMKYANREFYDGIIVANIFALRATNPKELYVSHDPIGPDNSTYIHTVATSCTDVVCAWGNQNIVTPSLTEEIIKVLGKLDVRVWCLGRNKNGSPKHPLYVRGDKPLESFP